MKPQKSRVIPVLDVKNNKLVRGRAGKRSEYQPLFSWLAPNAAPYECVSQLLHEFGPSSIYLADLDAIAGAPPAWPLLAKLANLPIDLWVDAGIRSLREADALVAANVAGVVVGLETLCGPQALDEIVRWHGAERAIFSLDLHDGSLLGPWRDWQVRDEHDWLGIARRVVNAGIKRMILLDLGRVGMGSGTGTEDMCRTIGHEFPHLEIFCGGGVKSIEDVHRLHDCGAAGVLVASALHDGTIKPGDW